MPAPMIYGSVCSGIGAVEYAWTQLGWDCAFMSEIEPFARAVLQHHYPDVPLHGDFTTIEPGQYEPVDILAGGTPCQDFSIAGLRAGLDGERGSLTIEFVRLCERLEPRYVVFENVPGILSADAGEAFGIFLGAMADIGYYGAWDVLDSQWFGVAQRRRRVWAVFHRGDWRRSAAVLLEPESLRGHIAPSRQAVSGDIAGAEIGAGVGSVTHTLKAEGFDASEDGTGRGIPMVAGTLCKSGAGVARTGGKQAEPDFFVADGQFVRRLMPEECEELQAFPRGYTAVTFRGKRAADSPRYRALGNSMTTTIPLWIGRRIEMLEKILQESESAA